MRGFGHIFLKESFDILTKQTFKDFEIVISDHSRNDLIENLCKEYSDKLAITYYRNKEQLGNYSFNINTAIKKSTGKLIKILLQDDILASNESLREISDSFNIDKDYWLVTPCIHSADRIHRFNPFYPRYNLGIQYGKNTIGSPSVLTIRNDHPLLFDEKLIWLNDCDYYKRWYSTFGPPVILKNIGVVIGVGDHQITNTIAKFKLRQKEFFYIVRKYKKDVLSYPDMLLAYIKLCVKPIMLEIRRRMR